MKSFPLLFLIVFIAFVIWLRRRSKRLTNAFWRDVNAAGFDQPAELPADLQKTRPYLSARRGSSPRQSEETLLLIGSTQGALVSVGNGALVMTVNYLVGFFLPKRLAFKEGRLLEFRKSHPTPASLETLPDGSQLFLWAYPFVPAKLAKVLSALQDAMPLSGPTSTPDASLPIATPAGAVITQAITPRSALEVPALGRFFASGQYASEDPAISTYVKAIFSCKGQPTPEDYDRVFLEAAKKGFAWIKHPDAEPTHMTPRREYNLPAIPLPEDEDQRPLLHWKITAGMDCPDIKRGFSLSGVFGWPEKPTEAIVRQMVNILAIDSLVKDDDSPEDAEYSYIIDISVTPTSDALTHPEAAGLATSRSLV